MSDRFWSRVDRTGKCWVWTGLTPESVRQMRADRSDGMSERALARRFGVGATTVHAVLSGASWSDV